MREELSQSGFKIPKDQLFEGDAFLRGSDFQAAVQFVRDFVVDVHHLSDVTHAARTPVWANQPRKEASWSPVL